jgi:hypothetical protein
MYVVLLFEGYGEKHRKLYTVAYNNNNIYRCFFCYSAIELYAQENLYKEKQQTHTEESRNTQERTTMRPTIDDGIYI